MTVLLGSVVQGGTNDFVAATDVFGSRYQASATGTVDQLQVAVRSGSTFTSLNFAVYSDSASAPNAVLGQKTGAVTDNTAGTKTAAWAGGPAITSGTFYWLFLEVIGGSFNFTGNLGLGGYRGDTAITGFQDPWLTAGDSTDPGPNTAIPILVEQVGGAAPPGILRRFPLGL